MGENRTGIRMWAGVLFFALGIFASLYVVYDLRYPNRFVGDMYGMEVMFRLFLLFAAAGPMLLGAVFVSIGGRKKTGWSPILGTTIIVVSSLVLIAMAADVALSRRQNEIRKSYPEKSVEELLAIARNQKDQHAVDALMARADPVAVPGLALILLDTNQPGNLRYVAAQALARIGGEEARAALEKARDSADDPHFKGYLEFMIQEGKSKP
jgi:hypothetical protein